MSEKSKKSNLVVKTNQLNSALQNLSLAEIRIIQLAIVDARETQTGLSADKPLRIESGRYSEVFETTRQNAYQRMKEAEDTLFTRRFSFIDDDGKLVKSRWISQVKYLDNEGAIEIAFTPAVVKGISRINGAEDFFTSYLLEQTTAMGSNYSVRLYELLAQWKKAKSSPVFELNKFREQLGLGVDEYKRMGDFKKRVLELAVSEINEKSDLKVSYEQEKRGRRITGFKFTVKTKDKPKDATPDRDPNTADMFTNYTDKQLARAVHSKKFIADYNGLVAAQNPANQSSGAWISHMVEWVKKDPKRFTKRPMQEYLDDEQAQRF